MGRIGLQFFLRGQKNVLAVLHRSLQGLDGHDTANIKMNQHLGEGRKPTQWQNGQHPNGLFFIHGHIFNS